jgi:DNA-binding NarL/FixJ family response regulator
VANESVKSTKVIIVDDSSTMRAILRTILRSGDIDVIDQLSSGERLLQSIAQSAPDIVCMESNLPDCNGIDLLKSIADKHPDVAVVMFTAEHDPNLQRSAAEFGAVGFIHKPFSQDQIISELRKIVQSRRLQANAGKSSAQPNADVAKQAATITAVVADDSLAMRTLMIAILTGDGIKVVGEAVNGQEAVDKVAKLQPDIVCLDVVMPEMDGMEAMKQIRRANPVTKIMMVTSMNSREVVIEAVKEGAVGFIVKPFEAEKFSEAIAKALGTQAGAK